MNGADLALFVMDGSEPESGEERELYEKIRLRPHIRIRNKGDIDGYPREADVTVSALTGENMDVLRALVAEKTGIKAMTSPPLVRQRQLHAVTKALDCVRTALRDMETATPDCVSADVKEALEALYSLIGEDAAESVVDEIFSKFCVGK